MFQNSNAWSRAMSRLRSLPLHQPVWIDLFSQRRNIDFRALRIVYSMKIKMVNSQIAEKKFTDCGKEPIFWPVKNNKLLAKILCYESIQLSYTSKKTTFLFAQHNFQFCRLEHVNSRPTLENKNMAQNQRIW